MSQLRRYTYHSCALLSTEDENRIGSCSSLKTGTNNMKKKPQKTNLLEYMELEIKRAFGIA